jgi:alginate O-acetyltransferase complex protein AlgI
MNFDSIAFFVFLAVTLASRLFWGTNRTETSFLIFILIASFGFYAWHTPPYVFILLASATVDYFAGIHLGRSVYSNLQRQCILAISLCVNLGILFFFKYYNFFITESIVGLNVLGFNTKLVPLDVLLPMGISFYTFQSMSSSIDVYKRQLVPVSAYWKYMFYISFFPQLTAGPIVRAKEFIYQIGRRRRVNGIVWSQGAFLIIKGLFLKMVIADNLGIYVNMAWDSCALPHAGFTNAFFVVLFFGILIFADFEGYTSIARGIAYLLGFKFPVNFRSPYIACTFKEFWSRWHMTLSRWLRDYLYIPLGGNRCGKLRNYFNLVFVMFLGGLWHGAAITFVIWGLIHGLALAIEKLFKLDRLLFSGVFGLGHLIWFIVVQITIFSAWVFFRSESVPQALGILRNLFGLGSFTGEPLLLWKRGLILILPIVLMHLRSFLVERQRFPEVKWLEKSVYAGLMLFALFTCKGIFNKFIYFQF